MYRLESHVVHHTVNLDKILVNVYVVASPFTSTAKPEEVALSPSEGTVFTRDIQQLPSST